MRSAAREPMGWTEGGSHKFNASGNPLVNLQGGREGSYPSRMLGGGSSEPQNGLAHPDRTGWSSRRGHQRILTNATLFASKKASGDLPEEGKSTPLGLISPIYGGEGPGRAAAGQQSRSRVPSDRLPYIETKVSHG